MMVAVIAIGFVLVLISMWMVGLGLEKGLQKIRGAIYSLESTVRELDRKRSPGLGPEAGE